MLLSPTSPPRPSNLAPRPTHAPGASRSPCVVVLAPLRDLHDVVAARARPRGELAD
ncbi:MAG: hypothetical protein AVDCRST_MAG67-3242 [uncultured Solirubrobacteraceae bacterium]|uniref:Uncharacterized protein n=1 Tax=uncultured Solirubrobacteraceae bacterium TaxID=1162706 RepID=A0A6J4TCG8_9ACTN|nr:MAG: hypothetical protein AVDCRST_MAG67-3242 [uncultured Solirubrobacteraceae bacterium]